MNLEERYIHEGRVVFDNFADLNYVWSLFHFVELNCLLEINEQIYPRFILEFYSQFQLNYSEEGQMFVEFVIQNQLFSYSLETFAQILDVPCQGACVFTDRWRLDELAYGIPFDGPYQTNLPPIEDIISSIRIDREGQVRRIRHEEEIDVLEYQILTSCASLESKNEVCLLCEVNPKQIPAFDFICASLESILAIEDTWERERSGFAEEKVWGALPVVTGFWGGKEDFLGELAAWSPEDV
ncbi:hypothetical protein Tco_0164063 [Tanacetum coccineum]